MLEGEIPRYSGGVDRSICELGHKPASLGFICRTSTIYRLVQNMGNDKSK